MMKEVHVFCKSVIVRCTFLTVILLSPLGITPHALSDLRKVYVPADRVQDWPKGEWVPVKSKTLFQYTDSLSSNRKQIPAATVDSAVYRATFSNGTLEQGQFSASLSSGAADDKKRIEFDTLGLDWSSLLVPNGSAVIGSTIGGKLVAEIKSGNTIQGRWSSHGRVIFNETEFRLRLLPARSSVVYIKLPVDLRLEVSGASLFYKERVAANDGQVWKIEVGSRRDCTIRVIPNIQAQYSLVSFEERHNWFVQKPTVRLAAEYDFRILDRREKLKLTFAAPPSLQIEQVILNGQQIRTYSLTSDGPANRLSIDIPIQNRGSRYQLLVLARSPLLMSRQWRVPFLRLTDHQSQSSVHNFRFEEPLRPLYFSNPGFELIEIEEESSGFPQLRFKERTTKSSLSIYLTEPDASVECVTMSTFSEKRFTRSMDSINEIYCRDGSANILNFLIPLEWSIREIQCIDTNSRETVPFKWNSEQKKMGRELSIQLRDPVNSGNSVLVQINAFRTAASQEAESDWQPIVPTNTKLTTQYLQLVGRTNEVSSSKFWRKIERTEVEDRLANWNDSLGSPPVEKDALVFEATTEGRREPLTTTSSGQSPTKSNETKENQSPKSLQQSDAHESHGEREPRPNSISTPRQALAARCRIKSRLLNQSNRSQLNHARYEFIGDVRGASVVVAEPENTKITSILVNGNAILLHQKEANSREFRFRLSSESTGVSHGIDVFYSSHQESEMTREVLINAPEVNFTVLGFEWDIESLNGSKIARVSMARPSQLFFGLHDPRWKNSLLGPFVSTETRVLSPIVHDPWLLKGGGSTVSLVLPMDATQIVVQSSANHFERWLAMALFLFVFGILIQVNRSFSSMKLRITIVLAATMFAAGIVLTPKQATFSGAIALASLLVVVWAILAPRVSRLHNILIQQTPSHSKVQSGTIVVLILSIGLQTLSAADLKEEPRIGNILVPFDDLKEINQIPDVIFVDRKKLEDLKLWYLRKQREADSSLIESAEYSPEIVSPGVIGIRAKYLVSVDEAALPYQLALPLRNVTFPGTKSCLINGREGELVANDSGDGVTINLPAARELTGTQSSSTNRKPSEKRRSFEVEISFIPRAIENTQQQFFRFGIPEVHFSTWKSPLSLDGVSVRLRSSSVTTSSRETSIGATDKISFQILRKGELPVDDNDQSTRTTIQIATLFEPSVDGMRALSNLSIRRNESDELNYLAFQIPVQCRVKDVSGTQVARFYKTTSAAAAPVLVVELKDASFKEAEFTIGFDSIERFDGGQSEYELPMLKCLPQRGVFDKDQISNLVAIQRSRFNTTPTETTLESHTIIPNTKFLELWNEDIESDTIASAYAVSGDDHPLVLKIDDASKDLQIEEMNEISIEEDSLLLETLMRFENVPKGIRVLHVNWDRRFQVESVFSEHDGVQKKVTPLRLRDELLLLFGREVEQRQTIFVKGRRPGNGLPVQTIKISLPWIPGISVDDRRTGLEIRNSTIRPIEVLESKDWVLETATPTFAGQGQRSQVVRKFKSKGKNQQQTIRLRFPAKAVEQTRPDQSASDNLENPVEESSAIQRTSKLGTSLRREYVIHQILHVDQKCVAADSFFVVSAQRAELFQLKTPTGCKVLNVSLNGERVGFEDNNEKTTAIQLPTSGLHSVRVAWTSQIEPDADGVDSFYLPDANENRSHVNPVVIDRVGQRNAQLILKGSHQLDASEFLKLRRDWIRSSIQRDDLDKSLKKELLESWLTSIDQQLGSSLVSSTELNSLEFGDSEIRRLFEFDSLVVDSEPQNLYMVKSSNRVQIQPMGISTSDHSLWSYIPSGLIFCGLVVAFIFANRLVRSAESVREEPIIGPG